MHKKFHWFAASLTCVLLLAAHTSTGQNTGGRFKGGGSSSDGYAPKGRLTHLLQDLHVRKALEVTTEQIAVIEEATETLKDIEQKLRRHDPRSPSKTSFPELIETANQEMERVAPILWERLTPEQRQKNFHLHPSGPQNDQYYLQQH